MASLTGIRDAAVAFLRPLHPELIRVEAFSGEISLDTVSGKSLPSGVSLLVAAIGADNDASPHSLDLDVLGTFAALIVSNNLQSAEAREADALAVAEAVALAIHGETFGLPWVSPAVVRSLEAVRDSELDNVGVAIWSVVWQQSFIFGPSSSGG